MKKRKIFTMLATTLLSSSFMSGVIFATDINSAGSYETTVIDNNSDTGEFSLTIPSEVQMNEHFSVSLTKAILPDNKTLSMRVNDGSDSGAFDSAVFPLYAADGSQDGQFNVFKGTATLTNRDNIFTYYSDNPQPTASSPITVDLQPKRDTSVAYTKDGQHSGPITFVVSFGTWY
ncbi:hypothetical protein ACAW68_11005 [Weissella confusa]|uniref:hypothetical protein n=1 Tax=Weissella confusa TaxID=1583 RepID=UPI0035A3A9A4